MSEISSLALGAGMTQERLKSYIDDRLSTRKAKDEIEEELMNFGLDRETASDMVRDAMDDQWQEDGGNGPLLSQVGPRHMIAGSLLFLAGIGATVASYASAVEFGAPVSVIFYGAIFAGGVEFAYGIIRVLDG